MAFSMQRSHVRKIHRILGELLAQAEADGCLVCDEAGHVVDQVGVGSHDPHLLSALGAGVFAATRELARLLGEDEFSVVLHQGTKRSILMCAVNAEALLAVIFSANASVGLVKMYAPLGAESLRGVLEEVRDAGDEVQEELKAFVLDTEGEVFGLSGGR